MKMTQYAGEVRRFGSARPFVRDDGTRMNLAAGVPFAAQAVSTDGAGNITDMPLCRRKWCFGRPERYVRGAMDLARAPYSNGNPSGEWQLSKCQRCAVAEHCADIVVERIESDETIEDSFIRWDDQTTGMLLQHKFEGSGRRSWLAFLDTIERSGGWTSVNDQRVAADDAEKLAAKQATDRKRKADQLAHRRNISMARPNSSPPASFTAINVERERRLKVLLDLRQLKTAPRRINKLTPDGCERTADVWMAKTVLGQTSKHVTGTAIAEWLARNGRDHGRQLNTLTGLVYNDLKRILELERSYKSGAIWTLFNP